MLPPPQDGLADAIPTQPRDTVPTFLSNHWMARHDANQRNANRKILQMCFTSIIEQQVCRNSRIDWVLNCMSVQPHNLLPVFRTQCKQQNVCYTVYIWSSIFRTAWKSCKSQMPEIRLLSRKIVLHRQRKAGDSLPYHKKDVWYDYVRHDVLDR